MPDTVMIVDQEPAREALAWPDKAAALAVTTPRRLAREKKPAFQFYPRDLLADTRVMAMDAETFGCYWLLVCVCWGDESIPDDADACAKLLRGKVTPRRLAAMWPDIRACFIAVDGALRHKRLDAERTAKVDWSEQSRRGGLASAAARLARRGSADPRANREPEREPAVHELDVNQPVHERCEPNVNPSSSSSSSVPPNPLRGEEPGGDDDAAAWLMEAYPRWYAEERAGATYRARPTLDWQAALGLTATWSDRAHLERMCRTFLRASNLPAAHANRSLEVFARAYASGCDAAVRQGAGA